MSDINLFHIANGTVQELAGSGFPVERSLQSLMERHLEAFLGVRFLASEYATGRTHGGRIDTLGLDENGCPVIIEYKRSTNENVINQGLYYLDWLLDHQAEFTLLVMRQLGNEAADAIEWSTPRLLCIAGNFNKFDEHAVQQINRNIELIRYRRYGDDFLLLELVNDIPEQPVAETSTAASGRGRTTVAENLARADAPLTDLFEALRAFLFALSDDVQMKTLKYYFAFKRLRNFACVEVYPQANTLLLNVKVDPDTVDLEEGFTRDMRGIGHYGTGDLQIRLRPGTSDFEKAKPLLERSYESA